MSEKIQVPDGSGGWKEIEATRMPGSGTKADSTKQAELLQQQYLEDAGMLTERLGKYIHTYCKEQDLTPEHAAFAVALLAINLREDFPVAHGGSEAFDAQAAAAADYYNAHVPAKGR